MLLPINHQLISLLCSQHSKELRAPFAYTRNPKKKKKKDLRKICQHNF